MLIADHDRARTGTAVPNGGLRMSIATACLSGTLEDKLAAAAAAGFDGIELFESDLIASDWSPSRIRQECARRGLSIDAYQPFRDFEAVPPGPCGPTCAGRSASSASSNSWAPARLLNFAPQRTVPPGTALICALGVESGDPARSAQRADRLLAPVLPRAREPGEADLSSVAAPAQRPAPRPRPAPAGPRGAGAVRPGTR